MDDAFVGGSSFDGRGIHGSQKELMVELKQTSINKKSLAIRRFERGIFVMGDANHGKGMKSQERLDGQQTPTHSRSHTLNGRSADIGDLSS